MTDFIALAALIIWDASAGASLPGKTEISRARAW